MKGMLLMRKNLNRIGRRNRGNMMTRRAVLRRRRFFFVSLFFNSTSRVNENLNKGNVAISKVNLKEAVDAFDAVLKEDPNNITAMYKKAMVMSVLNGPTDECFELINKAISSVPDSSEMYDGRAALLVTQKKYWNALDEVKKAINLNENNMMAHWVKANAHKGLEQHQPALLSYDKALEYLGDEPDVHLARGECLYILESPDAFDWIERLPRIDEYHPRKNFYLAIYEYRKHEFLLALDLLESVKIGTRMDTLDLWILKGDCYLGLRNYDSAIASYLKVLENNRIDELSIKGIVHAYQKKRKC